jgi:ABC-type transport system involved in multi-copper enzyme maturation permease subunit
MKTILAIAQNTFRETMRDKILLAALVSVLAIILFTLFIASISLDQGARVITHFGTTTIYLLQIFVAVFIGSALMHKEIEQGTFFLVIPKPISRAHIILGKTLGLTTTTFVVTVISTLALFAILLLKDETIFVLPILLSVLLSTLEASLLILITILFSSFTSPILSAICTIIIYLAGHSGDSLRAGIAFSESPFIDLLFRGIYYLLPNLEKFNTRNEIVFGALPSIDTLIFTAIYFITYAGLVFILANSLFKRREF